MGATIVLLFACFPASAQALRPDIRFDNYTGRYGFPRQMMISVIRDSTGYVWAFGNGLYRFDGLRITRYNNTNNNHHQLKDNYVAAPQVDNWGRLWLGSAGLAWYDKAKDRFNYIRPLNLSDYEYAYGQRIIGNDIWYVTQHGLCKTDLRTLKSSLTALRDGFQPWLIMDIGNHELLYTTANAKYFVYNIVKDTYKKYELYAGTEYVRIKCGVKIGNTIWLGTNRGVWRTDNMHIAPKQVKGLEKLNVKAIRPFTPIGGDSLLWLGTNGNGLVVINRHTEKIVADYKHESNNAFSLSANNVEALDVDKDGKLWVAHENGISVLNPYNQQFKTHLFNFENGDNLVFRMHQDRFDSTSVWISVGRQGLLKQDWFTKKITRQIPSIGGESTFYDFCQVSNKVWLLNSYSRLFLWHEEKGLLKEIPFVHVDTHSYPFNARAIFHGKGRYFITTNYGLYVYEPEKTSARLVYAQPPINSKKMSQFVDNDMYYGYYDTTRNCVWVSTRTGLLQYDFDRNSGTVHYNHHSRDVLNANALNMATAGPNGLVVSCARNGLSLFDPAKGLFTEINRFGSVVDPALCSSLSDSGKLWISSSAGIFSYDIIKGTAEFFNYLAPHTEEFSLYQISRIGNEICFGYRSAYSYFNLSAKRVAVKPSQPVIEKILVNQQPFYRDGDSRIDLSYDQDAISFYFTAFEYNNSEVIRFRYQLAEQDTRWTESGGERIASYNRLPPGKYRFLVQSGSASGVWNDAITVVAFTIEPPFWRTWWFATLAGAVLAIIVIASVRHRIQKIKWQETEKTRVSRMMAELELRALRSQMNPHFIFNSINSIQRYIWENKQEDASEYLTKFANLIRMILDHSMYRLISLEQELASLQLYVELEHRRCNNKFDYDILVSDALETHQVLVPPMLMQPYIENAIWHGLLSKEDRGRLEIHIRRKSEYELEYVISDDGIGRTKAKVIETRKGKTGASYGMQITSQRLHTFEVNGHHGKVEVDDLYPDREDTGTIVTITVPAEFFEKIN